MWDSLTLVFEPQDIDSTLRRIVEELPSEVEILEAGLCPDIMSSPSILRISSKITLSSGETMPLPGSNAVLIRSNLAFGTGHHPTTEFCIRLLEKAFSIRSPKVVLDLGTGSGVLALCAVKLGAKKVIALDVDPRACWEAKPYGWHNKSDMRVHRFSGGSKKVRPPGCQLDHWDDQGPWN